MTSLEIVKERVSTANKRNLLLVNLSKEELEQIEKDLEILELIIKWKEFINIEQNYEYLLNDEIRLFNSDIKLLNTYLRHHKNSYIPISFRKVGESNE